MANRFWVGGTATWDATAGAKWATTSGGTSGAAVPTAADDVYFDANSGTGTATLATSGAVCRSLNCTGTTGTSNYTGTLTIPASTTFNIGDATAGAGNIALKLNSTMAYNHSVSSVVAFISTSATVQTVDTATRSIGAVSFTGSGSWKLTSSMTTQAGSTVTHTAGTLDTNGQACSWGFFAGNSATTRTLTLGASTITLTGASGIPWNLGTTITGLTLNAGTSIIKNTGSNITLALNNLTYYTIDNSVTTATVTGNFTATNWISQPPTGTGSFVILSSNPTVTNMTFVCTDSGTVGVQGWLTTSATPIGNATRTITCVNAPTLQNFDFTDMAFTGTGAPYSGTNLGDGLGNSGLTFPSSRTMYWVGTATTWTTLARWATASGNSNSSLGAVHIPLAHDDIVFDGNSALTSGNIGVNRTMGRNIDFSAAGGASFVSIGWNCGLSPSTLFGNLTLKSGMVVTGTGQVALCGRGNQTLTSNGATWSGPTLQFFAGNGNTGTYTLQDDLTVTATNGIVYGSGTLDFNNKNVTTTLFSSTATNTRNWVPGSGTLNLTGTGTVIAVSDVNLTYATGTGTIFASNTSAVTGRTVNLPNGKTVNKLVLAANVQTILQWAGTAAGHFGTLNDLTVNGPTLLLLQASHTTTFTNAPVINSSSGNVVTITSTTAGTQSTVSKTSGAVSYDYLSLQDIKAQGGASWYAGSHSTNVSNNSGWFFSDRPLAAFMPFF